MLNVRKWMSLFLAFVLCCGCFVGCGTDTDVDNDDVSQKQTEVETTVPETTLSEPELVMDWSVFDSIGVDSGEAETIFTKLGLTYLTDLQPIGTSTINYQLFPFGMEESPINIMVEDGKITQVALRNLWVTEEAREDYFDDDVLPKTWYYKDETDYYFEGGAELGLIMYDTYMYENPYYIGVNWEARELYYF